MAPDARTMQLNITFTRPVEEAVGGGGDGEDAPPAAKEPERTLMSIMVQSDDSVASIERKIKSDIARLKAPPATAEEEEGAAPPVDPVDSAPVVVLVLPELSTPLNLKTFFNAVIAEAMGPLARDIATDARLFNFPIPAAVDITIVVQA